MNAYVPTVTQIDIEFQLRECEGQFEVVCRAPRDFDPENINNLRDYPVSIDMTTYQLVVKLTKNDTHYTQNNLKSLTIEQAFKLLAQLKGAKVHLNSYDSGITLRVHLRPRRSWQIEFVQE